MSPKAIDRTPRAPLPKGSVDDLEMVRTGGKRLDKFDKAVLSVCLSLKGAPKAVCLNQYNTIFDFKKDEIGRIEERLPEITEEWFGQGKELLNVYSG